MMIVRTLSVIEINAKSMGATTSSDDIGHLAVFGQTAPEQY